MTDLRTASDDEIEAELERRKAAALPPPEPLPNPDFKAVLATITDGVARSIHDGYEEDDFRYYVYETAMTAVYGPAYWEWRRQQKW